MFDSDYFYSSAPSDVSSDITINIENNEDGVTEDGDVEGATNQHYVQHTERFMFLAAGHDKQSFSDKITRKLFRKKRKEMLEGKFNR